LPVADEDVIFVIFVILNEVLAIAAEGNKASVVGNVQPNPRADSLSKFAPVSSTDDRCGACLPVGDEDVVVSVMIAGN